MIDKSELESILTSLCTRWIHRVGGYVNTLDVFTSRDEVNRFLKDRGIHGEYLCLGVGCFSLALLDHLSGKVIKVSINQVDKAPMYWEWCKAHQGEEFVPVIHDTGHLRVMGRELSFVVMDRLYHDSTEYEAAGGYLFFTQWAESQGLGKMGQLDCHGFNVMYSYKDSKLYVTDPLSFPNRRE
ncbi:putative serine/threonine-protein kinase [Aquamicrobium phage P14]|uniref:Putative serine/threonine-protein kinase n=1 Tax=Aquamicrobium phage P14 TaxID=1927013 RepID=A0A1L5C056_9CAUD|nr:putative serine/threonine-protein kinase [Aquamicrobium phage P14]APL99467.1 putative serine/threonine-protein kinase [Aquamicrobium phage P14]